MSAQAALLPPRFEGSIQLADGRRLGFAEYGPSRGRPLLWFHGTPGARRQIAPEARAAATARNVRLIAIERPGIGASTAHLYGAIREFAPDIEQLCNALEIERFAVAGLSGGGPYALSCAHHMPERVVAVAVLGGVAPAVGADAARGGVSTLARTLSPLFARTHRPLGASLRALLPFLEPWKEEVIDLFARLMPTGDRLIFEDPGVRAMFVDDLLTGARQDMRAFLFDAVVFGREWGFRLEDVRVPIHLWYGDADNIVPVEHGEHLAGRLPNAILRIRKDEGHLGGLGATHEIFDALLDEWERID